MPTPAQIDEQIQLERDAIAQGLKKLHKNTRDLEGKEYASATVYGAGYIFIDHVQRLAYLSNTGVDGATSTLTTLGSRAAQLAKELNIGVIFISQVNDDGRTKYAASLEEEAIICIKIDRDTETDDEVLQNTTNFILDKNRPFAKLGHAGSVYYDPETTILTEGT